MEIFQEFLNNIAKVHISLILINSLFVQVLTYFIVKITSNSENLLRVRISPQNRHVDLSRRRRHFISRLNDGTISIT